MCCCEKPTINGQPGYRWNNPGGPAGVYPINPPALEENDTLLYDEPGRCGGCDAHSHHYRIIRRHGRMLLLVRHGGGDEAIVLHSVGLDNVMRPLDTNSRYWLLHALYYAHHDGAQEAR
jgi:hypothetical protein